MFINQILLTLDCLKKLFKKYQRTPSAGSVGIEVGRTALPPLSSTCLFKFSSWGTFCNFNYSSGEMWGEFLLSWWKTSPFSWQSLKPGPIWGGGILLDIQLMGQPDETLGQHCFFGNWQQTLCPLYHVLGNYIPTHVGIDFQKGIANFVIRILIKSWDNCW